MATYPVYDEHGDLVGHYEWSEIPILFKDNWYLEKGKFYLGRPKDAAPPVSANEQVRLIDPDGVLCGYYSAEQVREMPEPVTHSGNTASLLSRPTPYKRLQLLRDSYYNCTPQSVTGHTLYGAIMGFALGTVAAVVLASMAQDRLRPVAYRYGSPS